MGLGIIRSETEIFQKTNKSWEFKDCTEPMLQIDCCLVPNTLYGKRGIATRQLLGTIIAFSFWKTSHTTAAKIKQNKKPQNFFIKLPRLIKDGSNFIRLQATVITKPQCLAMPWVRNSKKEGSHMRS